MKIINIEAIPVIIPFNTEWEIATGSNYGNGYVVVKLQTDTGICGIGEIGRFFEGESQLGIVNSILNFMGPTLMNMDDPLNINKFHENLVSLKENRFAKAAVDIALYDLKAKVLGIPVYSLLGGMYREKIRVCQSIGIKELRTVLEDATKYVSDGFSSLKVKIGVNPKQDLFLVSQIRKVVGSEIEIRVDANQGYTSAEAIPTLKAMEEFNLSLIEQPVPLWDMDGMKKVCAAIDTPILACESARTPEDIFNLAHNNAADMINIKLGRPRGITGAKKMEAVSEACGLPVTVGTMMEMGVGTAAAAHFAAACNPLADTCDCTGPTLLEGDILKESLIFSDGYLKVPQGVGLGVELDEEKLDYFRIDNGKV